MTMAGIAGRIGSAALAAILALGLSVSVAHAQETANPACDGTVTSGQFALAYSQRTGIGDADDGGQVPFAINAFELRHPWVTFRFQHSRIGPGDDPAPVYWHLTRIAPDPSIFLAGDLPDGVTDLADLSGTFLAVALRSDEDGRFAETVGRLQTFGEADMRFQPDNRYDSDVPLYLGEAIRRGTPMSVNVGFHDGAEWRTMLFAPLPDLTALLAEADAALARIRATQDCIGSPGAEAPP